MTGLLIHIVNFRRAVGAAVVASLAVVAVPVVALMIVASATPSIPLQRIACPGVHPLSFLCCVRFFQESRVHGILYCQPNIV